MSLSRAFNNRKLRMSFDSTAESKGSQRGSQPLRHKISAPMQLLHTTNILSYNAPDLPRPAVHNSPVSTSSSRSDNDSDSIATVETTPPASPDAAKAERRSSPKRHHLSDFFKFPAKPLFATPEDATVNETEQEKEKEKVKDKETGTETETETAPAIPLRAPSHTKKNSIEALARSSSVSRQSRDFEEFAHGTRSRSSSTSTRNCSNPASISARSLKQLATLPSPSAAPADLELSPKDSHPFGPELAQVTELAEEYSSSSISEILTEDSEYILSHGLSRFSAAEYIVALEDLSADFFSVEPTSDASPSAVWI